MRRPRSGSGINTTTTSRSASLSMENGSSGSSRRLRSSGSNLRRNSRTSEIINSNKNDNSVQRRRSKHDAPVVDQYPTQQISATAQHHQLDNKGVSLSSSTSDQSYDLDTVDKNDHSMGLKYDELSITSFYSDADGIMPVVNNFSVSNENGQSSEVDSRSKGKRHPLTPGAPKDLLSSRFSRDRTTGKTQHHPWVEESPVPERSKRYDNDPSDVGMGNKATKKKKGVRKLLSSSKGTASRGKTKKSSGSDGQSERANGSNRNNNSSISRVYGTGGVIYDQTEGGNIGEGMHNNDSSSSMNDVDDDDSSDDEYTAKKSYRVKGRDASSSRKSSAGDDFANSFKAPTVVQGVTALSAAAITGGILLGPFGVLLGAGALVAAAGYQSLPEEQREQIHLDAQQRIKETYEFGEKLTDRLGNSCAVAFEKTGDVIGCHNGETTENQQASSTRFGVLVHPSMGPYGEGDGGRYKSTHDMDNVTPLHQDVQNGGGNTENHRKTPEKSTNPAISNPIEQKGTDKNPTIAPATLTAQKSTGQGSFTTTNQSDQNMFKLLASSRRTPRPALPVSQIHVLEPKFRPRAWLDLMCDPYSSPDDKNEAMEEILILAKDKHHGRMFLEEGILDALLSILNRFFKLHEVIIQQKEDDGKKTNKKNSPEMDEFVRLHQLSLLAANLCVALGKAHCAVVHTEGDLLLMSSYKQGAVPEGRQLAQMLYEIPHRLVITSEPDAPNAVNGARRYRRSDDVTQNSLRYRVKEMSLEEAECLAKQIKDLTEGYYDPSLFK